VSSSSVLVINSGSSSIKYQLVDPETGDAIAKGLVERIGDPMGLIKHVHGDAVTEEELPVPDHTVGMREVLRLFDTEGPTLAEAGIVAVGQGQHDEDGGHAGRLHDRLRIGGGTGGLDVFVHGGMLFRRGWWGRPGGMASR